MTKEEFMKEVKRLEKVRTKVCTRIEDCDDCKFQLRCQSIDCLGDLWDYAEKK